MSEAPIRGVDSNTMPKLPVELQGDSTLQLQLSVTTPPQSVPNIVTSKASNGIESPHHQRIDPSQQQGVAPPCQREGSFQWLGKYRTPGLSAFEILVKHLECEEVLNDASQHTPVDQDREDGGKESGRHKEWMNFISGCDQKQQKSIEEEEEEEEEETAAVVNIRTA